MKIHPSLAGIALLLALAACRPGAAEFTESEAPNQLTLDKATALVDVHFARGSSRLRPADAARLRSAIADGVLIPSDRITVAVGGSSRLANARFAAISAELLRYGIIASQTNMAGGLPDRAIIQSGRYMVTLPACPNWSKQPSLGFTNTLSSNFGCATATDLGMMVAYPADLAQGRPRGYADAIPEAAAVQRYEADKVVLPSAASLGPIAGTSAGPTGGGTGAGSAGSQP